MNAKLTVHTNMVMNGPVYPIVVKHKKPTTVKSAPPSQAQ